MIPALVIILLANSPVIIWLYTLEKRVRKLQDAAYWKQLDKTAKSS